MSLFGTNWRRYGSVIEGTICLFAWLTSAVCAGRPDRVKSALRGIVVAGAAGGIYGIVQYLGWDPLIPRSSYQVGEGIWAIVRPPGTLGYASYFATWLLLIVFLSAALAAMEDSPIWRRLAITVSILAAFAMWLTGTRAAILGLIAGLLTKFAMRNLRITRRGAAIALAAVIASAAFYYSPLGQSMRSRTRWFAEDPWGGARLALWRDSLHMASHRPATGFGPEVFMAEFPRYQSAQLAKSYPDFAHESPHNMFLDALVARGLPGLVLLLGLCSLAFATRRRPEITAGVVAAIAAQQFTSLTAPTAMMLFVAIAFLVALETPPITLKRRAPWVAGAVPVAAALLYLAVRLSAADHELELTKLALDNRNLEAAAAHDRTYEQQRLPGGSGDLWYSRALLELASKQSVPAERARALETAEAAARRATETAEDPFNAWYNLAMVYGIQNDAQGAEGSVRAAIAAHPTWYKPHWILARILRVEGRVEEARREAVLAADFDVARNPEVTRTLRELHP